MQIFTHLTANDIQLRPFPFKRELSMEAYLIENEGVLALDRDTFSDVEIIEDELTLKQGGGNQIVVTNQWEIGNIDRFIKQAGTLGYKITLANGNGKTNSYQS